MANHILTLIKVITALYLVNITKDKPQHILDELKIVINSIRLTGRGSSSLGNCEEDAVDSLYKTAEWMITHYYDEDAPFNHANLIQRLKVNLFGDNFYINIVEESLPTEIDKEEATKRLNGILSELRYDKRQGDLRDVIRKANNSINGGGEGFETNNFVKGLIQSLEDFNGESDRTLPGFVGKIDFNDPDAIEEILTKTAEATSAEGVIKTGLQALDRATGVGGLLRGAMVNFGALTHNYKSGILIDLSLFIPMFNDPWMWDDKKKPMILRISFENTLEQDIGIMYSKLYELQNGKRCILHEIETAKAAKALSDHFGQRGYEFHLESYDPNNFAVYDLFDIINKYLKEGYEIHAISCDYLTMISDNTFGDRKDSKIQKTYEMVRNFCYPKGITFLTAHQLSTEAQNLARENSATFTKKVCTGGWYMDCRSLHTKLDLEFVMHIHKHIDGSKYLMFSEGKNRACSHVSEKDRNFIYKFQEFGGIVPDYEGEDLSLPKLPDIIDVGMMADWGD